ncbi:MAG: type secretion system protein VirB11 [Acetobacteraceae bacterium]|jgi:type IV secretion system protein VirB11|nr:type secretion system protein VirB11 [Acetobacteraceae bacterium]
MSRSLIKALQPVLPILRDPQTEDLAIQEPGVGWWLKRGAWHRVDLPAMTYARQYAIAVMTAAQTRQEITPRSPILSADLLGDLRLQAVMPPAVSPGTMALTFRRGDMAIDEVAAVSKMFDTSRWNRWDKRRERQQAQDAALLDRYDAGDIAGFLEGLADTRQTGIFAGPTGVGKTRLSKLLGGAIPLHERIITIEDAQELVIRQPNFVRHFYAASGIGVSPAKLLKATLRERPDRVMLAEMRDPEAASVFLAEVMAGHPGSITTLHGRNAPEAGRRLFNLVKSSDGGQGAEDETIAEQLGSAIDFIIPVENEGGKRAIGEVWFRADAARRGETFRDLLRAT